MSESTKVVGDNKNGTEKTTNKEIFRTKKAKPTTTRTFWKTILHGAQWFFGHALPLYLIVGALCYIAAPQFFSSLIAPTAGKIQVPNTSAAPKIAISLPQAQGNSGQELRTMEIVRVAMDASKERVESIKEGNDKLFSIISALAALLVFLGFKGVETFRSLNTHAEETLEKSREARESAEETTEELKDFFENRYHKDNTAEINVAQGIVLREMAELYRKVVCNFGPIPLQCQNEYFAYLEGSVEYLNRICDNPENVDKKTVSRAFIVRGNVLKLMGKVKEALDSVVLANQLYDPEDYSSLYNAACYCSILSRAASAKNNHQEAVRYETKAFGFLRKAIQMNDACIGDAETDQDFDDFKVGNNPHFMAILYPQQIDKNKP